VTPRTDKGQFVKGMRAARATEFKPGQHWRPRKPHWDKAWLEHEYVTRGRSAADIATDVGIQDSAIDYWLRKHGIPRRTISQARALKHWGSSGERNPMFGKRGAQVPSWRGGHTPERQAFHASDAWRAASLAVWQRDSGACRRCGLRANDCAKPLFDVHHVEPFEVVERRADTANLVLLCRRCHRFVHSKKNVGREWLLPMARERIAAESPLFAEVEAA
jgi:5-methylcytosine-specific restriction endonuclease McrA